MVSMYIVYVCCRFAYSIITCILYICMQRECNGNNNNNNIIGGRNYLYDNAYRAIHNTTRIQYIHI